MDVMDRIREQIGSNPVILYMKGTPQFPQCGFSSQAANALKACNAEFAWVNILEEPEIRASLPQFSNWPTFPQLFLKGELIGGSDIIVELFEKGELQKMVSELNGRSATA